MKTRMLFLAYLFFCTAAWAQQGKIDSTEMLTLRIDPQTAHGAAVSQIFSEVEFIPLETTKESLFGSISQLKIMEDNYVIYDYDTKAILIFGKDGKYRAKINASNIEQDKNEKNKSEFYGFIPEQENNTSYIVVYAGVRIFYFDLKGKLVKKIMEKDYVNRHSSRDLKFASNGTIVRPDYLQKQGKDSTFYELGFINKNKDSVGYFPYSSKRYDNDEFWSSGSRYSQTAPDEILYLNYYSYDIYKARPSKLSLAYHIIFPAANSLPRDFNSNPVYVKKRGEFFKNNPKVFYGLSNTFLVGNNLYFKMHNFGWDRTMKKALIYNLKTSELTSIQDLEPDALSSFLPVTDASGSFYDFMNKGFQLYENGYFYTNYSSLAMFAFKEQSEGKTNKYPPALEAYFKTQNKKSNPVLIKLKPKLD
ncbi:hypothetical protein ASE74_07920 [Pedobacter sp. Leaf216]|uniref:6-bladed beta-propeller n=1 Tax=Pedobacter sp. Leaf216 TaxID=1735684 RepID=UPI0006FA221E|nr:6-bladed beta-propeller [Pedobacter sp. Leaf216]KQM66330.1 hypothetical protein ASE74_07920 [Pedobacter sp. Leaf216]